MSDLRSTLVRIRDGIEPPDDSFERLLARRERKRRRQRIRAGAVAVLVAAAGFAFAARAFFGAATPEERPVTPSEPRLTVVTREDDGHVISLVEPDGSLVPIVEGRDPAWSPDGSRVAFRRGDQSGGGVTRIFVADADGSNVVTIEPDTLGEASGEAGSPVWSPDGRLIAFDTLGGIYVMEPDGSNLRLVSRYEGESACYDLEPSWSPDGTRLVFAVICDGGEEGIWTVNLDGTGRRALVPLEGDLVAAWQPSWSPDGTQLGFIGVTRTGPDVGDFVYQVWVADADGSSARAVTDPTRYAVDPAWSPDGSRIAFTESSLEDWGERRVMAMRPDGSEVEAVTDLSVGACCPSWQPALAEMAESSPSPSTPSAPMAAGELKVPLPSTPIGVAVMDGSVWTGTQSNEGNSVVRVDAASGEVLATISVEHQVYEITAGAGAIWTTGPGPHVQRIDPSVNRQTGLFDTGANYAGPVAASPDGVWVVTTEAPQDVHSLVRLDPSSGEAIAQIPLGISSKDEGYIDEIVLAEGSVWLMMHEARPGGIEACGDVIRVDPETNRVDARFPSEGLNMAVGAGEIWLSCRAGEDRFVLQRLDAETGEVLDADVPLPEGGWGPSVVDETGAWLTGSEAGGRIVLLHLNGSLEVDRRIPVGDFVYSDVMFDPIHGTAWFAKAAPASLVRVDVS